MGSVFSSTILNSAEMNGREKYVTELTFEQMDTDASGKGIVMFLSSLIPQCFFHSLMEIHGDHHDIVLKLEETRLEYGVHLE